MYPARRGISRREFVRRSGALGAATILNPLLPSWSWNSRGVSPPVTNCLFRLSIAATPIDVDGRRVSATTINGSVPGPLLRLRQGVDASILVKNELHEDTSIHWHGILVPADMDGVPRVSFPGIKAGESFEYRFPVNQSGTYWYHSHSGLQEQTGVYGPIIIDPIQESPYEYDREFVIMLSDWTFDDPHDILTRLIKWPGYYNRQRLTLADFADDTGKGGLRTALRSRLAWGRMRMDPTDIADVTGTTYTYLMNGLSPESNWTGLFRPGERIRLRIINGSAASYFDVRIPGLAMTVVQADGQDIHPIDVDELRIATAETYDVIVQPVDATARTIFAEAMDRSGYALGTLAPRPDMLGPVPERRKRPIRTMRDMGMQHDMPGVDNMMEGMDHAKPPEVTSGVQGNTTGETHHAGAHDSHMPMPVDQLAAPGATPRPVAHGSDHHGRGNSSIPVVTQSRVDEAGVGLGSDGRRVLLYSDLRSLSPGPDRRTPTREIELHLTGNMERYMWSFDGRAFSEVKEPIRFEYGERLRLILVNDTMMEHPIHLHGMWMELENGAGREIPRKHTVNVKPAERLSVLISADAPGRWAFHCHILYHMEIGMFRVVEVSTPDARTAQ